MLPDMNRLLSEARYRLRVLLARGRMERELDAELHFHLERETEKLMRQGVPHAEAERKARAAFGGVERIKDDTRDTRGVATLESVLQDLRYAARGLRMRSAFSAGVILTLGLGIGANAAMFGVVDRVLFRAPPMLREPGTVHRLYRVRLNDIRETRVDRNFSFPTFLDVRRLASSSFSDVAAFQTRRLAVGEREDAIEVPITIASAAYFQFFDARPALGRFFSVAEDRIPDGAPVVVLSYGFWQGRFGGRNVLGEQLRIDDHRHRAAGVRGDDRPGRPGGVGSDHCIRVQPSRRKLPRELQLGLARDVGAAASARDRASSADGPRGCLHRELAKHAGTERRLGLTRGRQCSRAARTDSDWPRTAGRTRGARGDLGGRRRGHRAAHRVRQRGESDARARGEPAA
jgi:hypothetical protein